jgi:hypothetical protein
MTKQADFKRLVRARMAKTGESYATARAQLIADHDRFAAALHATNGDSAAGTLRQTRLASSVVPWRDALHEGPVPAVSDPELRRRRADFLAEDAPEQSDEILRWLEHRDETLAMNRDGEYVLWFEADLYDQLQLIQILAKLRELGVPAQRITLICIGEHLGIAHFGGLGELDARQLTAVAENAATPITDAALELAQQAWAAFRADHPGGLGTIAKARSPELRFLAEAFDRLSREYPSTRDGLALTERRVLAATAEGAATAGEVFRRIGAREGRPYLGDVFCWRIIERLAGAQTPLLDTDSTRVAADASIRLTPAGQSVLEGNADHLRLNGVDRWIGGVHLIGAEAAWRWDEGTEAIAG